MTIKREDSKEAGPDAETRCAAAESPEDAGGTRRSPQELHRRTVCRSVHRWARRGASDPAVRDPDCRTHPTHGPTIPAVPSIDTSTRKTTPATLAGIAFALVYLLAQTACTPPPPATVAKGGPSLTASEVVVEADFADADAAVRTAVRREQMAIERRRAYRSAGSETDTVLVFDLRTVRGDSGELTVKNLGSGEVLVRCRIGAMGSEAAESALVAEVIDRLESLRGKDYAPASD